MVSEIPHKKFKKNTYRTRLIWVLKKGKKIKNITKALKNVGSAKLRGMKRIIDN